MPRNKVSDPITDQASAFACLVLSGAMTTVVPSKQSASTPTPPPTPKPPT